MRARPRSHAARRLDLGRAAERFGAADVLREVLLDYLDRGVLNVIDEGRAWHVCLNPAEVERYHSLGVG